MSKMEVPWRGKVYDHFDQTNDDVKKYNVTINKVLKLNCSKSRLNTLVFKNTVKYFFSILHKLIFFQENKIGNKNTWISVFYNLLITF